MFLSEAKGVLSKNVVEVSNGPRLVVCVGNEAADADSIISSLCYAYMKNHEHKSSMNEQQPMNKYIPMVNIERKCLHLRRDVDILLSYSNLTLNDLLCLDDISGLDLLSLSLSKKLGVVLLDHNELSLKLQTLFSDDIPTSLYIDGIIDHHKDQNMYPHLIDNINRNIAFDTSTSTPLVGSCCTLIVEELVRSPQHHDIIQDIGILLKGVLLLDTINMDAKAGKGTPRDLRMLDALEAAHPSIESIDRAELFHKLDNAKTDIDFWRSLSASDALSLDYKDFSMSTSGDEVHVVGVASIILPADELLSKDDSISSIVNLLDDDKDMIIAMGITFGSHGDKSTRRQLLLTSKNSDVIDRFHTYIQHDLQLIPTTVSDLAQSQSKAKGMHIRLYDQSNLSVSRKQMAVLLQKFYDMDT